MTQSRYMHFEGVCPFLFCLIEGPHAHPICPVHGTVQTTVDGECGNCRLEALYQSSLTKPEGEN